jgi:hypothetical protein
MKTVEAVEAHLHAFSSFREDWNSVKALDLYLGISAGTSHFLTEFFADFLSPFRKILA